MTATLQCDDEQTGNIYTDYVLKLDTNDWVRIEINGVYVGRIIAKDDGTISGDGTISLDHGW